jgi:hypothetical protein
MTFIHDDKLSLLDFSYYKMKFKKFELLYYVRKKKKWGRIIFNSKLLTDDDDKFEVRLVFSNN